MLRKYSLYFLLLFTVVACGYLLFYRLDALPLRLWDEGRRAVNALEMWTGESPLLVPTFLGEPEHWGTKPPVLIWLQALAMKVWGPSILAVRLPAAVAALLTCLFLVWFSMVRLKRKWAGIVAGLVMVTTPFFMGAHAARAGDYDAVLVLFLTVGVLGFYDFLHHKNQPMLLLAMLSLTLALWTKGVAALFFLPGIFLLCILDPNYRHAWINWKVYAAVLIPLISLVGYYFLRDHYDPGFLRLLWENELGGRFSQPLEGHRGGPMFYVSRLLFHPADQPWWICLVVAPLLYWRRPEDRSIITYLVVLIGTHLLILSLASTKLLWYAMPQVPLYCLLLGLGFQAILDELTTGKLARYRAWIAISSILFLFVWPYLRMMEQIAQTKHGPEYASSTVYGGYLPALDELPSYTVLLPSYNASAIFNIALARRRGSNVDIAYLKTPANYVDPAAKPLDKFTVGQAVVVCEMATWLYMKEQYVFSSSFEISPCKCLVVEGSLPPSPKEKTFSNE